MIVTPKLAALALCCGMLAASQGARAVTVQQLAGGTAHQTLFAVALDGKVGLAVGGAGEILASADGGATWAASLPAPTPLALLGVAISHGHAIAVGQEGLILLSQPPGAWTKIDSGTKERLFAVRMNATGQAVAVGAFGTIIRSDDEGAHWRAVAPDWSAITTDGQQPHLYDATIDDAGTVTVAGEFGLILRNAGGAAWQTLHKGSASLFGLQLRADKTGFAVGQSGAIVRTTDGGATWTDLQSGTTAILLGVQSRPDGHVLVTALHDMLSSEDDGKSWTRLADPRFTTAWYQGILEAADGTVIVTGHAGELLHIKN